MVARQLELVQQHDVGVADALGGLRLVRSSQSSRSPTTGGQAGGVQIAVGNGVVIQEYRFHEDCRSDRLECRRTHENFRRHSPDRRQCAGVRPAVMSSEALEVLFALWPLQPIDGQSYFHVWQIVTYAFLHGTENIYASAVQHAGLWMFGAEIERYVGPAALAGLLFRVGGHRRADSAVRAHAVRRAAGADDRRSGGVFGLLLAYALMFPKRKVVPLIPPIPMPAWLFATALRGGRTVPGRHRHPVGRRAFRALGGMIGSALVVTAMAGQRRVR